MEGESQAAVTANGDEDPNDKRKSSPVVPDGGWGWFVVFAVFVGNVLTDGTIGTFGLFYPFIKSEYGSSPALTSLTGSLMPATYMIAAPLIGALIRRFGCRRVSVVGGVIAGVGLGIAAFSADIGTFAIFYGCIGGIGIGMNSLTGHLMVNLYFHTKRGIANGIVSAGAGMGVFAMAPLLQHLLEEYSWRGTMLIYSGCVLQYCVCGMLMRPLTQGRTNEKGSETPESELTGSDTDRASPHPEQPLLKQHKAVAMVKEQSSLSPRIFHSQDVGQKPSPSLLKQFTSLFHVNKDHSPSAHRSSLPDLSKNRDEQHTFSHRNLDTAHNRRSHDVAQKLTSPRTCSKSRILNPLDRKDIFYSGSIYNLKEFQASEGIEEFVNVMTENVSTSDNSVTNDSDSLPKQKDNVTLRRRLISMTSRLVDLSVFRYNVYIPVLLGGIFIQMGQFIPLTFLPNYCYSIGLKNSDVTIIIAVFGVTNIFGRLTAGCLANVRCLSSLWLCTFGNFMSGLACGLFPFCTTLETLCLFASGFGYFIGYFAPLQVLIMVEYIGIDKLTSAYGILQLCKGPAALFGPPLAGMVYQWTSDYSVTLLVASVLFTLSAVFQATVPLINRISKARAQTSHISLRV